MSTLENENAVVNAEATVPNAEVPPADSIGELEPTAKERKVLDLIAIETAELVQLAAETLDPKDALKKYCKLGNKAHARETRRRNAFKGYNRNDYFKGLKEVEELVRLRVPVKEIEMDKYVRLALWVDAVRPLVKEVDKLSFYQAKNKFLHTFEFNAETLSGSLKEDWKAWVVATVKLQTGPDKLSMKELDESIAAKRKELDDAKKAKKASKPVDPEKELAKEKAAAEVVAKKERRDAQNKIFEAIDAAIASGHASPLDVAQIATEAVQEHKLAMPGKYLGFDPATCTVEDCKKLAATMAGHAKLAEMKVLRDALDAMMKIAERTLQDRISA